MYVKLTRAKNEDGAVVFRLADETRQELPGEDIHTVNVPEELMPARLPDGDIAISAFADLRRMSELLETSNGLPVLRIRQPGQEDMLVLLIEVNGQKAPQIRTLSPIAMQRIAHGLTQQQVADRMGVKVQLVNQWETGRIKNPRPKTMSRLARAIGCEVSELREKQ